MTSPDVARSGLQANLYSGVSATLLEATDVWDQSRLLLSTTEVSALFDRGGLSPERIATMCRFESFEDFVAHSNNFWGRFSYNDGLVGEVNRRRPYVQRYAILHSEEYVDLARRHVGIVEATLAHGANFSDPWWHEIYEAYDRFAQLVDIDDKYVIREGKIDDWFLCR